MDTKQNSTHQANSEMKMVHLVVGTFIDPKGKVVPGIQTAWYNKELALDQCIASQQGAAEFGLHFGVVSIPIQDSVGEKS